jgi:hypothetical protein
MCVEKPKMGNSAVLFAYLIVQIQEIGRYFFLEDCHSLLRGNGSFERVNDREFIESCVHNLNRIIERYFGVAR